MLPRAQSDKPESTMARLRREAEETKMKEKKEQEEHREKFRGHSAISSSDYFGVRLIVASHL